jgi:hypothetical protein
VRPSECLSLSARRGSSSTRRAVGRVVGRERIELELVAPEQPVPPVGFEYPGVDECLHPAQHDRSAEPDFAYQPLQAGAQIAAVVLPRVEGEHDGE